MFGRLFSKSGRKATVEPWDGAKPYLNAFYEFFLIDEWVTKVASANAETRFVETHTDCVDANHWATLLADVSAFQTMSETRQRVGEIEDIIERSKFLTHMLKAFRDGDRFIVAKLAYDGGAA